MVLPLGWNIYFRPVHYSYAKCHAVCLHSHHVLRQANLQSPLSLKKSCFARSQRVPCYGIICSGTLVAGGGAPEIVPAAAPGAVPHAHGAALRGDAAGAAGGGGDGAEAGSAEAAGAWLRAAAKRAAALWHDDQARRRLSWAFPLRAATAEAICGAFDCAGHSAKQK